VGIRRGEVVKVTAIIVAFALWTVAAFYSGYKLRDYRAATAAQTAQTDAQASRADAVTGARANDHANAQTAARGEQTRIDRSTAQADHFDTLHKDIETYAHVHSPITGDDCNRGTADADFMRIWTEANAGAFGDATEYHDPASTTARAADVAPAGQR
jgi:hypothetical protein